MGAGGAVFGGSGLSACGGDSSEAFNDSDLGRRDLGGGVVGTWVVVARRLWMVASRRIGALGWLREAIVNISCLLGFLLHL